MSKLSGEITKLCVLPVGKTRACSHWVSLPKIPFLVFRPIVHGGILQVYNLYNSEDNKSADITLDFADAGLPSGTRCAVYDFWENRLLGYATDSFTGRNIPPNGSLLLRFTPLAGNYPQLVGSNLHLSIGATEIEEVYTTSKSIKLLLTDAGAQTGDLIFHSTKNLEAGLTENCSINSVTNLGDNLWKVSIKGRIWNSNQSLVLKIK
jgi:hypothetical protein